MSLTSLLSRSCTIIRRTDTGTTDVYGNPTSSESLINTTCSLQQRQRTEEEGQVSETTWDLYLPSGTGIDTSDRVLIGSAYYEVIGQPWDADEGSSEVDHVEATVKRVATATDVSS